MQYLERVTWHQYVHTIAAGDTNVEISRKTGINPSKISRWGQQPKAEDAVAFARGYSQPALEALIAAGYITAEDAKARVEIDVLRPEQMTNQRVVELVAERLGVYLSQPPATLNSDRRELTKNDFDLAAMSGMSEGERLRNAMDSQQEAPDQFYDGDEPA